MAAQIQSTRVPALVGVFNPVARRLLKVGALLGPNALITVRGRKSGLPRTTPVALVELDGRRWVIGTFGETNWVRNLRTAGEATLTVGRRKEEVMAHELKGEAGAAFFRDTLGPYVRRLPVGVGPVLLSILGAKDILQDPVGAAEHRPVFELEPAQAAAIR
jgi:deazaflavin-dependent oxidoreductase (nitroreductase family)